MSDTTIEEELPTLKPENKILIKSYQKTIQLKDGKLYDGQLEVDLTSSSEETLLKKSVKKDPEVEGYKLTREFYKKFIARPFENIIIMSGAGTSKSSGGKLMRQLWDEVFPEKNKKKDAAFFNAINFNIPSKDEERNLEDLLSQAQKATSVLDVKKAEVIKSKIKDIEAIITAQCTIPLGPSSPHLKFLNKITSRKHKYPRVKIFTLNYDTLFEQAAAKGHFITIDGFSFANSANFNGAFFDYDIINRKDSRMNQEENFISKVFHLYKPHGSINWEKLSDGQIIAKDIGQATENPLIIYPNSNKYESGYDQPFFEMMSRFQQSIRQPNTLLICVGFSFGDKHFKNVIEAAIQSNPSLNLLVYTSDFYKPNFKELLDLTEKQNNIIFINDRFDDLADNYPFSSEYDHSDEE